MSNIRDIEWIEVTRELMKQSRKIRELEADNEYLKELLNKLSSGKVEK